LEISARSNLSRFIYFQCALIDRDARINYDDLFTRTELRQF
jgi:hypothetical protein